MQRTLSSPKFWYLLFAVLLLPALLINLGTHHIFVHTDESRRALVALEMILKNEYLAPTLNGEFYYEKPPLFNWLIVLSFKAFGAYSNFAVRFPVFLFVLTYAFLIHRLLRPVIGNAKAWLVLMLTVTSGRMLFYDSFLGLMDIGLGLLVFTNFMLFYRLGRQRWYFLLFVSTYALVAVGYLMKGLPSVVFQFFTILAWAAHTRDWKFIFHKFNFLGTLVFIIPVGLYYYFYEKVNPDSLLTVFEYTWHQSSQRTVTEYGIWDTVLNIFIFPFENLYHFAPWTLLTVCLFGKGVVRKLWASDFHRYAIIAFALNIWVYWTAPGVHPRYLFMFLPLFFAVLSEAYFLQPDRLRRATDYILGGVMSAVCLAPVAVVFLPEKFASVPYSALIAGGVAASGVLLTLAYFKLQPLRLVILAVFLLVLRIGFNFFILPEKSSRGKANAESAEAVVGITAGSPLYVLSPSYCHDATTFTVSKARGEVLRIRDRAEPDVFYIIHDGAYDPEVFHSYLEFGTSGTDRRLHLVKLLDGGEAITPELKDGVNDYLTQLLPLNQYKSHERRER